MEHSTGVLAPPVLTLRNLRVSFETAGRRLEAVRGIDLDVRHGELVALLGESGCGKSATARAVMGLPTPGAHVSADELVLGEDDLLTMPESRRRRLRGSRMSLVMQDALSALNPVLSIGDQITEMLRIHTGMPRAAARARAVELLAMVGIPAPERRVHDYPHQFSGGMRQRILIAMAVALEPELVIADEPTTALDVTIQAQVLDLLDRLRRELGIGVLLITHDLGVVMEVADRVAVMYAGRIVEHGPTGAVLTKPAHPYTRGLLSSVPRTDSGGALRPIPGSPPSPGNVSPACAFHPRCPAAIDVCRTERPALVELDRARDVACHRHQEVLDGRLG